MKRIVCELCESTNLIKQNGMFVCQSCGTKYSLEDAKKMMVEVDDPAGSESGLSVPVAEDNPQIQNLLELARVSLSSNNYAEAEKFCNQVIAIDAQNFDAWKLKGDAIAPQNTTDTPRALEVYNCYITAYRVLKPDDKEDHKREIIDAIRSSLMQNVLIWLQEVETKRPTPAQIKIAEDAFADSYSKLMSAYNELGITDGKQFDLNLFENTFIMATNTLCVNAWKSTVGYNYYRQDLDTMGLLWNKTDKDFSSNFRPMQEVFNTFIDETGYLVDLLKYAEGQFNADTDNQTKVNVFNNIAFLVRAPKDCCSYQPMVWTQTNEYGAVVNRVEYWEVDKTLTTTAKSLRETEAKAYDAKAAEIEAKIKQEAKDKYWATHADEKRKLDKELEDLKEKRDRYEEELESVRQKIKVDRLEREISKLNGEWMSLGIFKGREKREVLAQMDQKKKELEPIKKKIAETESRLNPEISKVNVRIKEIEDEFAKER